MPLSYLHDDYHKQAVTHIRESRWFESMYTLKGKTRPTRHVHFPRYFTYARRTLPAGSPRTWQPFTSHRQSWAGPLLPRRRAPDKIHSAPLTDPWVHTQLLSWASQWSSGGQSQASINGRLLCLLGPYHQYAIGTFNTYSRGPIHRSLTDIGGGYNLESAGFPCTTPRPSRPVVSPFYLRAPPGL
jgi:hypothetical protein